MRLNIISWEQIVLCVRILILRLQPTVMKIICTDPGAATLNEILYANKLGAEIVKLFPADAIGGANYVKAIRSPFPQLKLMPTGGVRLDEDNLNEWFSAGVVCVGIDRICFQQKLWSI